MNTDLEGEKKNENESWYEIIPHDKNVFYFYIFAHVASTQMYAINWNVFSYRGNGAVYIMNGTSSNSNQF